MTDWEEHERYTTQAEAAGVGLRLVVEMPNYQIRARQLERARPMRDPAGGPRLYLRPWVVEFRKVRFG